jgi:hypothetical protein
MDSGCKGLILKAPFRALQILFWAHGATVCGDILIVFFQGVGKTVVTVAIGDKVKIVSYGGMHGGFERSLSGIRDRPRRKSGMSVRVVRRLVLHVRVVQCPGISSLQQFRINHTWIGLQGHILGKAIVVNTRHYRAFVRRSRLFFDDGRHRHDLVDGLLFSRDQPDFTRDLAKLLDHGRRHFLHGLGAGEPVGVGEKVSFESFGVGIEIGNEGRVRCSNVQEILTGSQAGVLNRCRDIEHGEAFWNDNGVNVNVAVRQTVVYVDSAGTLIKEIFAGLQGMLAVKVLPEDKRVSVTNHARGFQFIGDASSGVSRTEQYEFLPVGSEWGLERPAQPSAGGKDSEQQQCEKSSQRGNSLDQEMKMETGRWSLAIGHLGTGSVIPQVPIQSLLGRGFSVCGDRKNAGILRDAKNACSG